MFYILDFSYPTEYKPKSVLLLCAHHTEFESPDIPHGCLRSAAYCYRRRRIVTAKVLLRLPAIVPMLYLLPSTLVSPSGNHRRCERYEQFRVGGGDGSDCESKPAVGCGFRQLIEEAATARLRKTKIPRRLRCSLYAEATDFSSLKNARVKAAAFVLQP